jgi:hypothetical protein
MKLEKEKVRERERDKMTGKIDRSMEKENY